MRTCFSAIAAAIALTALGAAAESPPPAWTAETLADKNAEARGGGATLQAITTLKRSGKLLVNGGSIRLDYVQMQKRSGTGPAMIRDEASLQGLTVIQAWDGTEGWQINPLQGRKTPERTPPDDNKALIEDADIEGPLIGWQAKHYTLDYLGTEDVDGTQALKLKVGKPGGDVVMVYLDPDYFVEIRTISQRSEHGVPVEIQADYGDYEKVAGAYFPFAIVSGRKGSTDTQKIQFDKGEANKDIPDAKFHFPAPNATVGPITVIEEKK
jgi:hypothetical protein